MIEKEDYELWRANPITEEVMRAIQKMAEKNKETWIERSWDGGQCEEVERAYLRGCHDANMDLVELTVDELNEAMEDGRT